MSGRHFRALWKQGVEFGGLQFAQSSKDFTAGKRLGTNQGETGTAQIPRGEPVQEIKQIGLTVQIELEPQDDLVMRQGLLKNAIALNVTGKIFGFWNGEVSFEVVGAGFPGRFRMEAVDDGAFHQNVIDGKLLSWN